MNLTKEQIRLIEAALLLWTETAKRSQVHPSAHPAVRHLFSEGERVLSLEEVLVLLNLFSKENSMPPPDGVSLMDIATTYDVPVNILRIRLAAAQAQLYHVGATWYYDRSIAAEVAAKLQQETEAFKRKYAAWLIEDPKPGTRDSARTKPGKRC